MLTIRDPVLALPRLPGRTPQTPPGTQYLVSSCLSAPRDGTYGDWQIVSGDTRISSQSGKSRFRRPKICSGEYF